MSKKKRGSSLITVVIIFAILITVGTATLSLTAADYSLRVGESNRVRNLYYSESGLDITYGVMGKMLEGAVEYGNAAVDTFMAGLNGTNGQLEIERQKVKNGDTSGVTFIKSDGSVDEDKIIKTQNSIFKEAYRSFLINEYETTKKSRIVFAIEESKYFSASADTPIQVAFNDGGEHKIVVKFDDDADIVSDEIIKFPNEQTKSNYDKLIFSVESTFKTAVTTATSLAQRPFERTVRVKYSIQVPDYKDTYYVETNKLELPINPIWRRAVAIDGNMILNGNVVIDGDVFVKGTSDNVVNNEVYDKYKGGIIIQGNNGEDKKVTFKGNVITSKTFQVKGSNYVEVLPNDLNSIGSLYSSNVYVGKSSSSEANTENSQLTVQGNVYTDNDLALNASKSIIAINNFYGIGDLTQANNSRTSYSKERVSSSILINTNDIGSGSSINIKDEAYIMGTAYIKTQPDPYQTGESVAVKGNYIAYASQLTGDSKLTEGDGISSVNSRLYNKSAKNLNLDSSKVYFKYYSPLQLVDSFNDSSTGTANIKSMTLQEKSDYFKYYAKENNNLNLKGKGVKLPENNTVSVGAFVTEDGTSFVVKSPTYTIDKEDDVQAFRKNYAMQVFEMGNPIGLSEDDKMTKYLNGEVEKKVGTEVLFGSFPDYLSSNLSASDDKDKIVINNNESKKVVLQGKNSNYIPEPGDIIINASLDQTKGIIVTKGNVKIVGEVNFKGAFIALGNLEADGNGKKNITYDVNYVERLIAYNFPKFDKVFKTSNYMEPQKVEVTANVSKGEANVGHSILTEKLITKKFWSIVK